MESIVKKAKSMNSRVTRTVKSSIKTVKNRLKNPDNVSNTELGIPPTYTLNKVTYDSWSNYPPEDWPDGLGQDRKMDRGWFYENREYNKLPEDVKSMNWYNFINVYKSTKKKYVKPTNMVVGKTYYIEELLDPPYKKNKYGLRNNQWYSDRFMYEDPLPWEDNYRLNQLVIYKGVLKSKSVEPVYRYVNRSGREIEILDEVLVCIFENTEGVFPSPVRIGHMEIQLDASVEFKFAEISDDSKLKNIYNMTKDLMAELKEHAEKEEYNIDSVFPLGKTAVAEAKQRFETAQLGEKKTTKKSGGRKKTMKKRNRK